MKVVATNKKAFHDYLIVEKYEAGIQLVGCEVKSIRKGEVNLKDSYVRVDSDLTLIGCHVKNYPQGSYNNVDPFRQRRLLMNKAEIKRLRSKVIEKGYTIIPLTVYFLGSLVKVEIALARGKLLYDKRQSIAEADSKRDTARQVKDYIDKASR
ncbi:MAG: SsrA-binding protein SmpB [Clostridia bacterium]